MWECGVGWGEMGLGGELVWVGRVKWEGLGWSKFVVRGGCGDEKG